MNKSQKTKRDDECVISKPINAIAALNDDIGINNNNDQVSMMRAD